MQSKQERLTLSNLLSSQEDENPYKLSHQTQMNTIDGDGKDQMSQKLFEYLIFPLTIEEFYRHYWEKRPLIIKRKNSNYYGNLFSLTELRNMIFNSQMKYTEDLDVTIYKDGKRQTLNPQGKVDPNWVWHQFTKKGCSVRLNYPQEHSDHVWEVCSKLEDWFGMGVSSNSYLTPARHGGFAPHFDDVEVFLLQTEGSKKWKLYTNSNKAFILSRDPSPNFTEEEIGEPSHEFVLEKGDLLYMPRGTIHKGQSLDQEPSLHLTISTGLRFSWYDFIKETLDTSLEIAYFNDSDFRRSLPRFFHSYMGVSHAEDESNTHRTHNSISRQNFEAYYKYLMLKLSQYSPLDSVSDILANRFFHERLPTNGDPLEVIKPLRKEIKPNHLIVLTGPNACRVVQGNDEEETLYLLFCTRNSRRFCEKPSQYLECELGLAPAFEYLISSYPKKVKVQELLEQLRFEARDEKEAKELRQLFGESLIAVLNAMYEEKILKIYLQ